MAKGGGGEGHYDERRRAAKPKATTGYADSPEVLEAVVKPKSKPTVVVKKKKVIPVPRERPGRGVQTDSNSGEPAGQGTKMVVTKYNVGAKPTVADYLKRRFSKPDSADYPGNIRQGALEAELRAQKPLTLNASPAAPVGSSAEMTMSRISNAAEQQRLNAKKGDFGGPSITGYHPPAGVGSGTAMSQPPGPQVEDTEHVGFGNWNPGGSARSLLDWVKRRNARRTAVRY